MKLVMILIAMMSSAQMWSQTHESQVVCQINEVSACPRGTYSYSCNGRYLYEVSCTNRKKRFIHQEEAMKYKEKLEISLNSCVDN